MEENKEINWIEAQKEVQAEKEAKLTPFLKMVEGTNIFLVDPTRNIRKIKSINGELRIFYGKLNGVDGEVCFSTSNPCYHKIIEGVSNGTIEFRIVRLGTGKGTKYAIIK